MFSWKLVLKEWGGGECESRRAWFAWQLESGAPSRGQGAAMRGWAGKGQLTLLTTLTAPSHKPLNGT